MSTAIRIVLNDRIVPLESVPPSMTLLDWLRGPMGLRGTKEGCAEGDCGACTVLWECADSGGLRRAPINACLVMLGQLEGSSIRTVEGLAGEDGTLHPVQTALVESDGTQCGFCTPGFVMAMAGFVAGGEPAEPRLVHDALAGNLCRCTGYRPIVAATVAAARVDDPLSGQAAHTLALLDELAKDAQAGNDDRRFLAPRSLAELLDFRAGDPQAVLLAGGTDLGLLASRDRQPPQRIIHVGRVPELQDLEERDDCVVVGAAVPYEVLLPVALRLWPAFGALLTRLGSRQIRNLGSIGGNLGTASPIGDALPVLLALDASVKLCSRRGARELPVAEFITGYRQTVLAADEVVASIRLPRLAPDAILHCDKLSKRRDQDISTVCSALRLRLVDGVMHDVRLALGGMAATPVRAHMAEGVLQGAPASHEAFEAAAAALVADVSPLDDLRGSAAYRIAAAQGLLRRSWLRLSRPDLPVEVEAL